LAPPPNTTGIDFGVRPRRELHSNRDHLAARRTSAAMLMSTARTPQAELSLAPHDSLKPEATALLDAALMRGEFERGAAAGLTALFERTARRVLNEDRKSVV